MSPQKGNDIEITVDEAKQIKRALEDDSFRKLMTEYVSEISDPKFREEQEGTGNVLWFSNRAGAHASVLNDQVNVTANRRYRRGNWSKQKLEQMKSFG